MKSVSVFTITFVSLIFASFLAPTISFAADSSKRQTRENFNFKGGTQMAIPVMVEEAIGGLNFGMVEILNLKVVSLTALQQAHP